MCAICKKPVRKITRLDDVLTGDIRFTVFCHREKEITILTGSDLVESDVITFGTAFQKDEKLEFTQAHLASNEKGPI